MNKTSREFRRDFVIKPSVVKSVREDRKKALKWSRGEHMKITVVGVDSKVDRVVRRHCVL